MPRKKSTETATKAETATTQTNAELLKKVEKLQSTYASIDDPDFVKSGSVVIDALLGGGIPSGTFILWSSDSGCGKSTGAMHIAKTYCVQGLKVLYLDFEGGVNQNMLDSMGLSKFLYHKTKNPEGPFICMRVQTYTDAETILDTLMEYVDLVVIDSATAILTEKIKGTNVESVLPGLDSRMMSNFLKKYKADAIRKGCTWIIINQMRVGINFMGPSLEKEAGGNALKFYPDIRIMMKKKSGKEGVLERDEETASGKRKVPYGVINEVWCTKSRYSRPNIPLSLGIVYGRGISNPCAYLEFLEVKNLIRKDGGWYVISVGGEEKKVQGKNRALKWVEENLGLVKNTIASYGGYRLLMDEAVPDTSLTDGVQNEIKDIYDDSTISGIDEGDSSEVGEEGIRLEDALREEALREKGKSKKDGIMTE